MPRKRSQVKRVHIDGEQWTYQVGYSTVSIRDPNGHRTHVSRNKIMRGHNDFEDYPTPGLVKNYIWRKLRPGQLIKEPNSPEQAKEIILNYFTGENDKRQEPERIARAQR